MKYRTLLALIVSLAATPALADRYLPAIVVAIAVTKGRPQPAPQPGPSPGSICENCNGTGRLGDGTVSVDCPECIDGRVQAGAAAESSATEAAPASIRWVSLAEAQASGKPIWIHVTGPGCGPCIAIEENVSPDSAVAKASQRWACVAMQYGDPMLINQHISRVPRDVFIRREANVPASTRGGIPCPMDAAGYVRHLNQWWSKSQ